VFILGLLAHFVIYKSTQPRHLIGVATGLLTVSLVEFCMQQTRIPHHFVAAAASCSLCVLLSKFPISALVNRITVMLGQLSFGIYLSHLLVLDGLSKAGLTEMFPHSNIGSIALFMILLALSAVVSHFLRKAVEKPFIALGTRTIARLEARHAH
jgi:peptidoglycan/LPS O-acetylase OafA/YrhL